MSFIGCWFATGWIIGCRCFWLRLKIIVALMGIARIPKMRASSVREARRLSGDHLADKDFLHKVS
jgi:hypothetical protein